MNDSLPDWSIRPTRPRALPVPARNRWQPLRLGLVELFHYDSEEFWFHDGHLLLRGNNGAGKSKVLSLTLPFLLDAQLKSSRIEPDGDAGKKMAWNLLLGSYDRRMGYTWIEFGRLDEHGTPRYLMLGAGLSAAAGRPQVDSWFFVLESADGQQRINQDIWLTTPKRVVLTRERLREALVDRGQVFETAASYRRAVDERLFHLGPRRYDALMDTLIQLRQPQLSKKPDEVALSNALTEALPPLAQELLGDVAEALGQLEEDRRQLDEYHALSKAIQHFDDRYRVYTGTQSRRQAAVLRHAQTEFDNASRARNEAVARALAAQEYEVQTKSAHEDAEFALGRERTRLEILLADPTMKDANQLAMAAKEAEARKESLRRATTVLAETEQRVRRAIDATISYTDRVNGTQSTLADTRRRGTAQAETAGIATLFATNALGSLDSDALAALTPQAFDSAQADMRETIAHRQDDIALVRKRQGELVRTEAHHRQHQQTRDERHEAAQEAIERREEADTSVEREGQALVDSWERHFAGLKQLQVDPRVPLADLVNWVAGLSGENPARRALQRAQQQASMRLALQGQELESKKVDLGTEKQSLEQERERLESGADAQPPIPYTRSETARATRPGASLWQLTDFRETVSETQRAGLEAALEAAGLLDAWIAPDGLLYVDSGETMPFDTQFLRRPAHTHSLADWLQPTDTPDYSVPRDVVAALLAGIACGEHDPTNSEAWVCTDGRYRLAALAGSFSKPTAEYIGYSARAAARARRIAEIAVRLAPLADELAALHALLDQHALDERQAAGEWLGAPGDEALRQAHLSSTTCAREYLLARDRLAQADADLRTAEALVQDARDALKRDAADLRLPERADALPDIETALNRFTETQYRLVQVAGELRLAMTELERQRERESEMRRDQCEHAAQLADSRVEAEQAIVRLEVLQESVGSKVDALQQRVRAVQQAVHDGDTVLKAAAQEWRKSGEARAIAQEQAETRERQLLQSTDVRAQAVARFQQFAATGLLAAALPNVELPDMTNAWTIEPALTLARRVDQALGAIDYDDKAWERVQRRIGEEFVELQRALSALGHQATADPSDWGVIIQVVYQNRSERPATLAARLSEEIAHREELLTANERTVLENHLQAEIAAEVQRLLQTSEKQVDAINTELHKRPTTTGVRYRLMWLPLSEEEGAPVGLEAARKRLLNTSTELWSSEDRRIVGAMLQQRIAAERERADSGVRKDDGGSLLDQLARALDYRRWHRFRVERWQDGLWRKLSGPASSGERALGLTVPLFAAVASFYSHNNSALAPRLMLLDEAFAGIDDTARAHCMGLIREFDLDFVITSEREWACYSTLPGVAICQLQRREGIDAVFVSRWTWDGRAKTPDADPDRRFPAP